MTRQDGPLPVSRAPLAAVLRATREVVSIDGTARVFDLDRAAAAVLSRWLKQGWLRRVGHGLYEGVQERTFYVDCLAFVRSRQGWARGRGHHLLRLRMPSWWGLSILECSTFCNDKLAIMRKLIFIGIVAAGALVGLMSASHDDWATRMVMSAVGALFAAPIAAVLTRRPRSKGVAPAWDESLEAGAVASPKALAANYWRDKGHPPFMKPQEAEPDKHMFDPDKLG